jgi:hypothetical protein
MTASAWNYFTPYRADVRRALEELQQHVFATGEYGTPSQRRMSLPPELLAELPPDQRAAFDELASLQDEFIQQADPEDGVTPKPATIADLREQASGEGAHSIIDIYEISDRPEFGAAVPMPESVMLERYGTLRPTRQEVEEKATLQNVDLDWQCWYHLVYEGGLPSEWYFEGDRAIFTESRTIRRVNE